MPQGLAERHLVIIHHEVERVTRRAAGVTLVERVAFVGDDGQRRPMIVVKRTKPDVLATFWLQCQVLSDQRD